MEHLFVDMRGEGPRPPLTDPVERLALLTLLARLAARWGAQPLAFRLEPGRARLVLRGEGAALGTVVRLAQSGHSAWCNHHCPGARWALARRVVLPSRPELLRGVLVDLHRGPGPLLCPWTSLWDGLGLRRAAWFDPAPLQALLPAEALAAALGLAPLARPGGDGEGGAPGWGLGWEVVQAASAAALGQLGPPTAEARALGLHLAVALGWTPEAVAALLGLARESVRRRLRRAGPPELGCARALVAQPALREALLAGLWAPRDARPAPRRDRGHEHREFV